MQRGMRRATRQASQTAAPIPADRAMILTPPHLRLAPAIRLTSPAPVITMARLIRAPVILRTIATVAVTSAAGPISMEPIVVQPALHHPILLAPHPPILLAQQRAISL